jgi:hypothetical protein
MTKILTTQNAQITTAAVEVKTLTISGKQVTLSVFRQLREKPLLADDLTLNGTPWGYVNYHPDKCGDQDQHIHVVWQTGNDLLRGKVFAPDTCAARSLRLGPGLLIEAALIETGLDTDKLASKGITGVYVDGAYRYSDQSHACSFNFDGIRFRGRVRHAFYSLRTFRYDDERKRAAASLGVAGSVDDLVALLKSSPAYETIWRDLSALPHLFIAV